MPLPAVRSPPWIAHRRLTQYCILMPQSGRRPQHQKRTLRRVCVMFALPPEADIGRHEYDVRFVP